MKFRRTFKVETVQNMSDDELGDLDWLTWEWIEGLAQSGSDTPYQQTAIRAIAAALHGDACPADPGPGESCGCGDYEREAEIALATAAPHLRATWEQPIRELHRPVHAVFSWANGPRYEEPCENCYGAPGVHECGCWADTQIEYVCAECHRLGSGSKGVYNYTYPCPTVALLEGGAE